MIAFDSLIVFSRSSPGTGPFIIQNLGPSHPPAKRTPENQLYAYAICDVSTYLAPARCGLLEGCNNNEGSLLSDGGGMELSAVVPRPRDPKSPVAS